MMFQAYRAVLGCFWLISIIACLLAIRWSFLAVRRRFGPALILSLLALAIACLGIARFYYTSTTTVNGVLKWRFDSKWLFIVSLVLSAFTVIYTIWRRGKSAHPGQPGAAPPFRVALSGAAVQPNMTSEWRPRGVFGRLGGGEGAAIGELVDRP